MGVVVRAHDHLLHRDVALKCLHGFAAGDDAVRFLAEAQAASQLEHPAVVPIYDVGSLPGGGHYYTMRIVEGRSLRSLVEEVFGGGRDPDAPTEAGWSRKRLVRVVAQSAAAVGYAHQRGVIHRDLKPDNIMVGHHGEVLVVDWGLAKLLGEEDVTLPSAITAPVEVDERGAPSLFGTIKGTPSYLSPEAARGAVNELGPPADVFGLGATLFEVLAGHPPYRARTRLQTVAKVLCEPPESLAVCAPRVSRELVDLVHRCLAFEPDDRPGDGGEVARALEVWLSGDVRRNQALELVNRANELERLAERDLRVPRPDDDDDAEDRWRRVRAAAEQRRELAMRSLEAALGLSPSLDGARRRLASHHRSRLVEALRAGADEVAATHEAALREHDDGSHRPVLRRQARLTLHTVPEGRMVLHRFLERKRRLVSRRLGGLGPTPGSATVMSGSYQVELTAPGHGPVLLPVQLFPGEELRLTDPEGLERPIVLPREGVLGGDDVVVSASWFPAGPDRKPVWVEGFVMRRYPVTNREYLAFLRCVHAQEGEEAALARCPRALQMAEGGGQPSQVFGRIDEGQVVLQRDLPTDPFHPDKPVVAVSWLDARAYCHWLGQHSGRPWRLPLELEWEKAARGADGRSFPWGRGQDPSWYVMFRTFLERPHAVVVTDRRHDVSPYGIVGLAGNVTDKCADPYDGTPPPVVGGRAVLRDDDSVEFHAARGGSYLAGVTCDVTTRFKAGWTWTSGTSGFRLVHDWPLPPSD